MKFLLTLLLIAQSYCAMTDPTVLAPGDIAIIGFNSSGGGDEFSFITFVDLAPGTIIYFTDCGWKSDNSFRVSEGIITYTAPTYEIEANTVITYGIDDGFATAGESGFWGLSMDGDQILVFQGSFMAPQFIFALNNNQVSWQMGAFDTNSSALPPGLTEGLNAVAIHEVNNAVYDCSLNTGSKEDILHEISNSANWSGSNTVRMVFPITCFDESLSVDMISFDVIPTDENNIIKFVMCNEEDIAFYELERSVDGKNFMIVATISPQTGKECNTYLYEDRYLESVYYRLKEVTTNEKAIYHKIIFAARENPVIVAYYIYDLNGKIIMQYDSYQSEEEILSKLALLGDRLFFVKKVTSTGINCKKVVLLKR